MHASVLASLMMTSMLVDIRGFSKTDGPFMKEDIRSAELSDVITRALQTGSDHKEANIFAKKYQALEA